MPGDLYVVLGFDVQVDDVLVLNGAFANSTTAIKLVFDNCELAWNGTTWVAKETETPDPEPDPDPEPPVEVEYTVYTITKIGADNNSSDASILYIYSLEFE